jgi:SAM-dependent methyltransferase
MHWPTASRRTAVNSPAAAWVLALSAFSLKKSAKLHTLRDVLRRLTLPAGNALELGCERGVTSLHLRKFVPQLQWQHADFGGPNLNFARSLLPSADVTEIAAGESNGSFRLPWAAERFHLVLLPDILEHVQNDADLLREAWRVTAPGGFLLITVPRVRPKQRLRRLSRRLGLPPEIYGHVREGYSEDDLRSLLQRAVPTAVRHAEERCCRLFCGPATESIELIVNSLWRAKQRRKQRTEDIPPVVADIHKTSAIAHTPKNEAAFRSAGFLWTLYRAVYPVLWLFSRLDLVLPKNASYCILLGWRKRPPTSAEKTNEPL